MIRAIGIAAVLISCGAFFASRQAPGQEGKEKDYAKLIRQLHEGPVSDKEVKQFVKDGTPALDALLNDFARSKFANEVRARLDKDFNLGKAIEKDVYASNVVKVAEAFGTAAYSRLMSRVEPKLVKALRLDTPKYKKLGEMAVQPLLIHEIVRGMKSKEQVARGLGWVDRYVDVSKLNLNLLPDTTASGFLVAPYHACGVYAYPHGQIVLADTKITLREREPGTFKELFSASARAKLKPLDPRPK
jgi:hypothetical protein